MSSPKAPQPTDPKKVGAATTSANVNTAIAQTALSNADENTPTGNVRYEVTGNQDVTDPEGNVISVPRYTRDVTLSPDEQANYDLQNRVGQAGGQLAESQLNRLQGVLDTPFTAANLPDSPSYQNQAGGAPTYQGPNGSQAPTYQGPGSSAAPTYQGPNGSDAPQYNFDGQSPSYSSNAQAANYDFDAGNLPQYNFDYNLPGSDRSQYEGALMSRLNRDIGRDRSSETTRLANMGVVEGSEAWQTAMDQQERNVNDARIQTYLNAGNYATQDINNQATVLDLGANLAGRQFSADQSRVNQGAGLEQQQFSNDMAAQQFTAQLDQQDFQAGQAETAQNAELANQQFSADQSTVNQQANLAGQQFTADQSMLDQQANLAGQQFSADQSAVNQQASLSGQQYQADRDATALNAQLADQDYRVNQNARERGLQEQTAIRNQPLNEIGALMSGSQVSMPQFSAFQGGNIAATNMANIYGNYDQQKMNAFKQNSANRNAMMSGLFSLGGTILGGPVGGAAGGAMGGLF